MNPFKPTAGKMPPILIGRESVIRDFEEALDNGAGAPGRLMLISGQRGFGKTVMLTELGRVAKKHDWVVVSDTASNGLCERLVAALSSGAVRFGGATISPSVGVGGMVSASLGSVSISPSNAALTMREAIEARLRRMPDGKGILFTIDEAQAASEEDLVALATAIQHVLRDEDMRDVSDAKKHGVAFVFAALPSMVDEVLNNKVLTFLRRSQQQVLAEVPLADVRAAYVDAVKESGKEIDQEDAFSAAQAAAGYPYMVQLVGYYMWQAADRRGSKTIERADVERGASDAVVAFGEAVCAPIMDGLTPAQREFVKAVAADAPSSTAVSDIAKRCSRSSSWVSKYRASLIKEHVIEADGKGYVRLSTPHMAEYLRGSSW